MCIGLTIGYLRYFHAKGWSLPIPERPAAIRIPILRWVLHGCSWLQSLAALRVGLLLTIRVPQLVQESEFDIQPKSPAHSYL